MSCRRSRAVLAGVLMVMSLLAGCGTVEHRVALDQKYAVSPGTRVEVGAVRNRTGQGFDIDVEKMLSSALSQKLTEKNLLWSGGAAPKLTLTADIVQYDKGDAFKRWLMPGWGATVLVVRGELLERDGRRIGSVDAKRTVEAGGGYTIGAWDSIFRDVADDIITKLAEQLK